jgi:hypothetical protein
VDESVPASAMSLQGPEAGSYIEVVRDRAHLVLDSVVSQLPFLLSVSNVLV